ncbi:MAG: Zn-ribbon domain-containing OB-fold protein [Planctomycetes bacterium]|nr:Zn-ribbon domain-containing OB-fold protein [Planctomycetota bacterium]
MSERSRRRERVDGAHAFGSTEQGEGEHAGEPVRELQGEVRVPYRWSYGERLTRFFTETRERRRLVGRRCTTCGAVLVPPADLCGRCFAPTEDGLVEVSDRGVLVSWTTVHLPFPGQPTEPPYTYGMVLLDGADTVLHHLILVDPLRSEDLLRVGMRVEAAWAVERRGDLFDIEGFVPA